MLGHHRQAAVVLLDCDQLNKEHKKYYKDYKYMQQTTFTTLCRSKKTTANTVKPVLTLKAPPITCSRRQFQILLLFQT